MRRPNTGPATDRLPDVRPVGEVSYVRMLPDRTETTTTTSRFDETPEAAWWEDGYRAELPDAPRWRRGSVLGLRPSERQADERRRPSWSGEPDPSSLESLSRLAAERAERLGTEPRPGSIGGGAERSARRAARERRREQARQEAGDGDAERSRRRRERRQRGSDGRRDAQSWDDDAV